MMFTSLPHTLGIDQRTNKNMRTLQANLIHCKGTSAVLTNVKSEFDIPPKTHEFTEENHWAWEGF